MMQKVRYQSRNAGPGLALLFILLLPCTAAATTPGEGEAPEPVRTRAADGLLASTLLGGSKVEEITDMAVAGDGTVYVAGWTESADFPTTPGAFDTTRGGASWPI